jgi:hypothetical protein
MSVSQSRVWRGIIVAASLIANCIICNAESSAQLLPWRRRVGMRAQSVPSKDPTDRPAWTRRDSWYTDSDDATPGEWTEVHQPLILPVVHSKINSAVAMLETKSAIPLSLEQAQTLLDVKTLDPDALLEEAAKDADTNAEEREKESRDPFFANSVSWMKEEAAKHRKTAANARSLKGKLKPYLVRALYLNEGTGRFYASVKDSTLSVSHGSLGHFAVPMKRRPVVIFLEKAPTKVYVSVSMAE